MKGSGSHLLDSWSKQTRLSRSRVYEVRSARLPEGMHERIAVNTLGALVGDGTRGRYPDRKLRLRYPLETLVTRENVAR